MAKAMRWVCRSYNRLVAEFDGAQLMSGAVCELSAHSPQGPRVLGRFLREGTSGFAIQGHGGTSWGREDSQDTCCGSDPPKPDWRLECMVTRNPSLPFTHWPGMNEREK